MLEVAEVVIMAEVVGFVRAVAAVVRHVAPTLVRDAGTVSAAELSAMGYRDTQLSMEDIFLEASSHKEIALWIQNKKTEICPGSI